MLLRYLEEARLRYFRIGDPKVRLDPGEFPHRPRGEEHTRGAVRRFSAMPLVGDVPEEQRKPRDFGEALA